MFYIEKGKDISVRLRSVVVVGTGLSAQQLFPKPHFRLDNMMIVW